MRCAASRSLPAVPAVAVLVLMCALLAGCASLIPASGSPVSPAQSWPERREALQRRADFALRGRVAVAAGDTGFSAALRWAQSGQRADLELDGPLGMGGLRILASGDEFSLTTSQGERLDGAEARAGLEQRLGFALPLESLRYWVLGVPDPAGPAEERIAADESRLDGLEQGGWRIDYPAYATRGTRSESAGLPRRVDVSRSDARVRLLIEAWSAPSR